MEIKKIVLLLIFHCTLILTQAQDKGMQFEQTKNWKEILAMAKAENKYIFIDCFTTWCGPCKFMSKNIFPLEAVGNFYNAKFINVAFQLDSTAKDADEIKGRYADAAFIRKTYKVQVYPSYLFFNPGGELVHRELGSSEAKEFIATGANALDTAKQYYTLVRKYDAGYREPAFLRNLALLAAGTLDEPGTKKYTKEYILTKPDLFSKENLEFIHKTTSNVSDTGFTLMLQHLKKFEAAIGKDELHRSLKFIIKRSEFFKYNEVYKNWSNKEWNEYESTLLRKYPIFAEHVLVQIKTIIMGPKNDWTGYAKAVEKYTANHQASGVDLNEYAWAVFGKCNDRLLLEKALQWSKKSFTNQVKTEPGYIDTYANLLYKLDRKKEALAWEMKAQKIAIEQGEDKTWGQDIIDKMNKGEKTW